MHFPVIQYFSLRNRSYITGIILAICLGMFLAGRASADEVPHLYEATIPVQNQDKEQRAQAIQAALIQVLIRVSGHADVGDAQQFPAIAQATQNATRFTQQFRYVKTDAGNDGQATGLALWVRFDETAISHLLRNSNLPVWGMTRPSTLVWLVVERHGQRKLLGADSHNDIYTALTEQAKLRGVPLRLPLLDLTDRSSLNTSDVWGNFGDTILQASQRYQTEAVLVGRVNQANAGTWTGRWTLYVDSGSENWALNGNSLADVLHTGIDKTAQFLAQRYGQVDQEVTSNVLVEVRQIKGLADYNRVVKYLQSISHVKDVQPVELAASSAIYRVTIPGGRLALSRSVALGNVLASEPVTDTAMESLSAETSGASDNTAANAAGSTAKTATAANGAGNTAATTTTAVNGTGNTAAITTTAANGAGNTTATTTTSVNGGNNATTTAQADTGKLIPDLSYRLVP